MWCRPRSPVEPMYMPGRLRTASRPSRTVMELPEYELSVFGRATTWGPSVAQPAHGSPDDGGGHEGRRTALSRLLAVSLLQDTGWTDRNAAVHALKSSLCHLQRFNHPQCSPSFRHAVPEPSGACGSGGRPGARARTLPGMADQEPVTPRTCLVTGATGYIGGRLVPELLAAGHRVR